VAREAVQESQRRKKNRALLLQRAPGRSSALSKAARHSGIDAIFYHAIQ
jgi:hypothetical protein